MKSKRCCFAGHSEIYDGVLSKKLRVAIEELIEKHNVKEFWVGNYGNFDSMSAAELNKLKEKYQDIEVNLVIPYITKGMNDYSEEYHKRFDIILMADISQKTPQKYKVVKANEYMVDNCDYMLCYVKYSWGGASKTLEYARRKKHIEIINLAD